MIWTRRTFLKAALATAAAATIPDVPALAGIATPVLASKAEYTEVIEILAYSRGHRYPLGHQTTRLRLTSNGQDVLAQDMPANTMFRWVAPPGGGLSGDVCNDSTFDLDVELVFKRGGQVYRTDPIHGIVPFANSDYGRYRKRVDGPLLYPHRWHEKTTVTS